MQSFHLTQITNFCGPTSIWIPDCSTMATQGKWFITTSGAPIFWSR